MAQDIITMRRLPVAGRYANQIFMYAYLKIYAKQHGLRLEVPEWVGNYLYGADDPHPSQELPRVEEPFPPPDQPPDDPDLYRNKDYNGVAQFHTSFYRPHREFFRSLFQPVPEVAAVVQPAAKELASRGRTIVGIHLRQSDFGDHMFFVTPISWYRAWLEQTWPTLEDPVLFVASDVPKCVREFHDYNPVTADALGCSLRRAPMYPDHYLLSTCHMLVIPTNSSFGFTAAMLNVKLRQAVRSMLPTQSFEPFDPWDAQMLFPDFTEANYPGIPGTFKYVQHRRTGLLWWFLRRFKVQRRTPYWKR